MAEEILYPFSQPEGRRVSGKEKRERLIRANRFRNKEDNIDTCMQCLHMSDGADCAYCRLCMQNGTAKKTKWHK